MSLCTIFYVSSEENMPVEDRISVTHEIFWLTDGQTFSRSSLNFLSDVDDDENIIINIDMDDQVTGDDNLIDNESDVD